jgi:hypothetical protein
MERAKRLELLRQVLQSVIDQCTYESLCQASAAQAASKGLGLISKAKIIAWTEELEAVMRTWPSMNDGMRQSVVAIAQSQFASRSLQA